LNLTDEDKPIDEISRIEAQLEQLAEVSERCRKIILVSKAAIVGGVALLLFMMLGLFGSNQVAAIGSIAVVLCGIGIVSLGSNVGTLQQTMAAMSAAEVLRSDLISRIDLRVVGERNGGENGAATSYNNITNVTLVSGTNTALVCAGLWAGDPGAIGTSTYNGVSMPQIGTTQGSASSGFAALFGLVNPATGSHNINVVWTNSVQFLEMCTQYGGVNQTGGTTSFANFTANSGTSNAPHVTVTTGAGDGFMDVVINKLGGEASTTQTLITSLNGAATAYMGAYAQNVAGPTTTDTWSVFSTPVWEDIGVNVVHH